MVNVSDIVLCTLNARYIHSAFGLRYLKANLGAFEARSVIVERVIKDDPTVIVEELLALEPRIVGLGVYIWNVEPTERVVSLLKRVAPDVVVVLGGPEVSFELDEQPICALADYVVTGEGEVVFRELCERVLAGERPEERVHVGGALELEALVWPYRLYTEEDIAHRVIYVEASRGCPFRCEFCLSSLDTGVRKAQLERFLGEMERLMDRGVRHFKFVDRTFNLSIATSRAILEFFLERYAPGLFVHFEMVPDRLPSGLREVIARFPEGSLQFEVGIQTFDEAVSARISRRQNLAKLEDNLRFLRDETGVHVHADLIVGLPGETLSRFGEGFDRLVALGPQEIQVGILKRLRGVPIVRHDEAYAMVYSAHPPYEIVSNSTLDFATVQRMKRFAGYWDKLANSGRFKTTLPLLWREGSPFSRFLALSDRLYVRFGRVHAIAARKLAQALFEELLALGHEESEVGARMLDDVMPGRKPRDVPGFLRPYDTEARLERRRAGQERVGLPPRQQRHG